MLSGKRHNAKRHNANRHNVKRHNANRHNAKRHNAKRHNAKRHNAKRHSKPFVGANRGIFGCVWFIYRNMELPYWLVPGNVKNNRIN